MPNLLVVGHEGFQCRSRVGGPRGIAGESENCRADRNSAARQVLRRRINGGRERGCPILMDGLFNSFGVYQHLLALEPERDN